MVLYENFNVILYPLFDVHSRMYIIVNESLKIKIKDIYVLRNDQRCLLYVNMQTKFIVLQIKDINNTVLSFCEN